ncbi:MAG: thioredoxin fold domain-containing protein [Gammaproteobacteria bacterium]|uniref:Thioredoxin fold domain-containing protein n=1 Tax=Candidatus Thiopontia autotrophica TaxID=2841688 RepID=A0A8J6P5F5_9GAMM|nr:thioredoxin fold domain-containing protein [Candidatus Thiopontia autotrophica]MBL6968852.1 thioredoxin fold domain-containing protein [Gammaproteobacteria bacterium]
MQGALLLSLLLVAPSLFGETPGRDTYIFSVPFSSNLQSDGGLAGDSRIPMILMFSADDCPYCVVMESDHLVPLLRNSEYDGLVLIRKIHLGDTEKIVGFSGEKMTSAGVGSSYGVWLTPTLLFLDRKGVEIQQRIIGLGVRDFVNGEIDESIMAAIEVLSE